MRLALGLDAAWTATEPSGVALVQETAEGWRLKAVESSYARFRERAAGLTPQAPAWGEPPDVPALLDDCRRLAGRAPDLVAVDMPLALKKIEGRRESDRAISRTFGAAKAATHSPSKLRPGLLADKMREDFEKAGFPLCTADGLRTPGLVEVYPHAALLALSGDKERLRYKAGKTTTYWRGVCLTGRRRLLFAVWRRIVGLLEAEIAGAAEELLELAPETRGRE